MSFHIGMTGTRDGMTPPQLGAFLKTLTKLCDLDPAINIKFHHGDCVGADAQGHYLFQVLAKARGLDNEKILIHPPTDESLRAFCKADIDHMVLQPKSHLARNREIVDDCNVLIACPRELEHQSRGGTWYTYDYAVKKNKKVYLILPNGKIK